MTVWHMGLACVAAATGRAGPVPAHPIPISSSAALMNIPFPIPPRWACPTTGRGILDAGPDQARVRHGVQLLLDAGN